ncbi:MAG: SMC-Scp complex subunit ScpB [Planctomycetia bacterium]|nr:SMC-Scp complex subunit ScpB [Planctomycetia bacterium]
MSTTIDTTEMARVEAVLFLMKEPCPGRKLAQLADVADSARARAIVRALNERYQRNGSAFCAVEVAGGFQLRALPEFAPWLMRLQDAPIETRLTRSAMETLAIIAYEQPVLRVNIERIRGVHCGEILRQLLEQNLIRIVGRSEELGRPFLYGTTKRFLQLFGLVRIEDLPRRQYAWASAEEAQDVAREIIEYDQKIANDNAKAPEDDLGD